MQGELSNDRSSKRRRLDPSETGPYVLRKLFDEIPLRSDEGPEDVKITCVEYWNRNLYIGTSASEILHFFQLPADPDEVDAGPTFILASRLQPSGNASSPPAWQPHGVRQILLLPGASKACVLCNGVLSFYTLPELSPAFPTKEPTGVSWIGGVDEDQEGSEEPVLMIANSKRILLVKVGERLRPIKNNIEYPSCLRSSRRGTIACVADRQSYALLEIEHQQKIPLFSISSVSEDPEDTISDASSAHPVRGSSHARQERGGRTSAGHSRSTSLGNPLTQIVDQERSNSLAVATEQLKRPPSDKSRTPSPSKTATSQASQDERSLSRPRALTETATVQKPLPPRPPMYEPLIISPSPNQFLLTTGSGEDQPGVGMFVNLDGDVDRGTIEFERYPISLALDKASSHTENASLRTQEADDVILALIERQSSSGLEIGIESQSLSQDPAIAAGTKSWTSLHGNQSDLSAGLLNALGFCEYNFCEVSELLRLVRLRRPGHSTNSTPPEQDPRTKSSVERVEEEKALFESNGAESALESPEWEKRRAAEEMKIAAGLGFSRTQILAWSKNCVWQVQQNPEVLRLEASLLAEDAAISEASHIASVFARIRNQEPQSEAEFLSLGYIKQKISLMTFLHLQKALESGAIEESQIRVAENILLEGGLDPRVILLLIAPLEKEVLQGTQGLWIHQGLADLAKTISLPGLTMDEFSIEFWMLIRRFLAAWQGKRGYGSIADEQLVFDSVDAALLHILLHLDKALTPGTGAHTSARTKLNNVVDNWKGNFDRAVSLLEQYRRLFVLSRLYQSRKMSKDVLGTWRRIVDGEPDLGGDKSPAEVEIQARRYLVHLRDAKLVEEYSLWLASRNSTLAIQFFTDDSSKVRFSPQQVTSMLKRQAPGAVQEYLEHLVFNKGLHQYADDLIGYYLDSVLNVLEHNKNARESLAQSYSTYRALEAPKPTYMGFITQNAPEEAWWQARLRLLQLLGSGSYATSATSATELTYSIPMVLARLAPYSEYLVSESIILDARQGRHKEALKLLTHGLGDYDTAVRYCYFGGPAPANSTTIDAGSLPSRESQQELFASLFTEFLAIEDVDSRLERTSHLLGTFATYFDPMTVLDQIPADWGIHMLKDFILRTLRAATTERNQAVIMKALSAAQNLQKQAEFVDVCEKMGAKIEGETFVEDGPGPAEITHEMDSLSGNVQ
jgi:hypothetical protein